jgi:hypothetical protein
MDTTPDQPPVETWDDIPEDVMALPTDEILTRVRLLDNDIKVGVNYTEKRGLRPDGHSGYAVRNDTATA